MTEPGLREELRVVARTLFTTPATYIGIGALLISGIWGGYELFQYHQRVAYRQCSYELKNFPEHREAIMSSVRTRSGMTCSELVDKFEGN